MAAHAIPFGCEVPPYFAFGVGGMGVGFSMLIVLSLWCGIPTAVAVILAVTCIATFVLAGILRRALLGREEHVLLEDLLLVLLACGLAAFALGQPVALVLDVLAPSLGAFLLLGRVGCLVAGCCHGRPSSFGITYRDAVRHHTTEGIRLFPIQLVEAVWLAAATGGALLLVLLGRAPGLPFWTWLIAYAVGRFLFELARGDVGRRYWGPLSEAQWLAIAIVVGRIVFEQLELAPLDATTAVALASAVAMLIAAYATRGRWLALPVPPISAAEVTTWQRGLMELEERARTCATTQEAATMSHGRVTIRLAIQHIHAGFEAHAYTIEAGGSCELDAIQAAGVAGMILQRLPLRSTIRAERSAGQPFRLWVLVDPRSPRPPSGRDAPGAVRLRANAAAREAFCAAKRRAPSAIG